MNVSRIEYLERFLDCVDFVLSGRRNAVSEDRWLVNNYDPSFYGAVSKHLKNSDERVRADVVRLLAAVRERAALDLIKEMRSFDKDIVRSACLGYLDSVSEEDTMIPEIFDILEHRNGAEFKRAAMRIGSVGRSGDVPRMRKIYGQVAGEMREDIKAALISVIGRDEELRKKKDLLLSIPVFPDEKRFLSFLDNSITYLDIRYRDSVAGKGIVSKGTYENVYGAIMKMRERMFNKFDNLGYYGPLCKKMYGDLLSLMEWASDDLSGKAVESDRITAGKHLCPRCGNEMRSNNNIWACVDCGIKK